jgi:hypothetical protein
VVVGAAAASERHYVIPHKHMGLYGIPIQIDDAASAIPAILSRSGYVVSKEAGTDVFVCETKHGQSRFWLSTGVPQLWHAGLSDPNKEVAAALEKAGVFMDAKEYFAKHHRRSSAG